LNLPISSKHPSCRNKAFTPLSVSDPLRASTPQWPESMQFAVLWIMRV
jgi:hypothetical protein